MSGSRQDSATAAASPTRNRRRAVCALASEIGRHEITHGESLADTGNIRPAFRAARRCRAGARRTDRSPARGCAAVDELAELIVELTCAVDAAGRGGDLRDDRSGSVAEGLTDAVTAALAVPVRAPSFHEPGVGVVVGLELADGRAVVAKVHRSSLAPLERLAAIARAGRSRGCRRAGSGAARRSAGARQRVAHRRGAPCRRRRRWKRPAVRRSMACPPRPHRRGPPARGRPPDRHLARRTGDRRPVARAPRPPLRPRGHRRRRGWIDDAARAARATLAATACGDVVAISTGRCRTWPSPAAGCAPSTTGTRSRSSPKPPRSAARR